MAPFVTYCVVNFDASNVSAFVMIVETFQPSPYIPGGHRRQSSVTSSRRSTLRDDDDDDGASSDHSVVLIADSPSPRRPDSNKTEATDFKRKILFTFIGHKSVNVLYEYMHIMYERSCTYTAQSNRCDAMLTSSTSFCSHQAGTFNV